MQVGSAADQIISELAYFSSEKQLDRRTVIIRMDAVRSELMSGLSNGTTIQVGENVQIQLTKKLLEMPDIFFASKPAEIKYDAVRDKAYSDMPTEYVTFGNISGIRQIKFTQGNNAPPFVMQKAGSNAAYSQLRSSQLAGQIGVEVEGQQLFYNNMPATFIGTNVLVTYMPTLRSLKETDVMPFSAEFSSLLLNKTIDALKLQRSIAPNTTTDAVTE